MDSREDGADEYMLWCGVGLLIVAPCIGWLLGDDTRVAGGFNWTIGLLAFGPLFLAGVVLVCFGALIRWLQRAEPRR